MNFNSILFFVLVIPVLLLYRWLPWKWGKIVLVIASYVFYGYAEPWYMILLFYSSVVDYIGAIMIHDAKKEIWRKVWLAISVIGNLGLLLTFKYTDFIIENVNVLGAVFDVTPIEKLGWLLPVGISFYTFQTLSYTIDVYRKEAEPCRDFMTFALYVAYFPQLVAGPIERASHLIKQLGEKHQVDAENIMQGIQRILWGLVKKCVIADRLAILINEAYANPGEMPAPVLLIVMPGFMLQLYLDFSAYTDIAIGLARLMGVKLADNFKHPLAARNPADFWNRWHITLTTWFRDYVFVTLGGLKRQQMTKSLINIMIVFTLTGIWHGARWNFVFFGIYAGLGVAAYQYIKIFSPWRTTRPLLGKTILGTSLAVFLHTVYYSLGGVFFRTPDIATALQLYKGALFNTWRIAHEHQLYILFFALMFVIHFIRDSDKYMLRINEKTKLIPVWAWCTFYLVVLALWAYDYQITFVYFQF